MKLQPPGQRRGYNGLKRLLPRYPQLPSSPPQDVPDPGGDGSNNSFMIPLVILVLSFAVLGISLGVALKISRMRRRLGDVERQPNNALRMRALRRKQPARVISQEELEKHYPVTEYKDWADAPAGTMPYPMPMRSSTDQRKSSGDEDRAERDITDAKDLRVQEDLSTSAILPAEKGPVLPVEETKASPPALITDPSPPTQEPDQEQNHNQTESSDDEPSPTPPIKTHLPPASDQCAICLDKFEDDSIVRGLPCRHLFHPGCIDPWLTASAAWCPSCKVEVHVPSAEPESPSPSRPSTPPA